MLAQLRNPTDRTVMATAGDPLAADARVRVGAANGLRATGSFAASGRGYTHWSGGPVAPGGTVTLQLRGLPARGDRWPGLLAGALAGVLGAGLVTAARRADAGRRGEPRDGVETESPAHISPAAVVRSARSDTEE